MFERYFAFNIDVAVNFFWTLEVGARYEFQRRTSLLDGEGFAAHQITLYFGFDW